MEKLMIRATTIPQDSEIRKYLAKAHLYDAFEVPADTSKRSALEIYIDILAATPAWVNRLMAARNRIVTLFGLKNLGRLNNVDGSKTPDAYQVGDHVGIFTILFLSDREVVLVESDKHLDARVSIYKTSGAQGGSVVMSTAIQVNNLMGQAYLLVVWPLHKLIVPALLARSR